jgi:hypothetical protein
MRREMLVFFLQKNNHTHLNKMPKSTKKLSSDHICSGCNHNFSSAYTLKRHNTSSKCAAVQNEKLFVEAKRKPVDECCDHDAIIIEMQKQISEMEESHEKLLLRNRKLQDKIKEMKGADANDNNRPASSKLPKKTPQKLKSINIKKTKPFTKEYLNDHINYFTLSMFKNGVRGVAEFILKLVKHGKYLRVACTDVSRNKFYVLSQDDVSGEKVWSLDGGGGLHFINFVLDELRCLADEYIAELADNEDKYIGTFDAIASDMLTPLRDNAAQKIRAVLKEHLCI